ncbi:translocation/assembly module TamB domain-containing protein [Kangiella sp. TOML190]|uniref:translocation/assembly module TamB domain-containing protein n=1 Tax=Kangiella sp. TOML190 TaxID=2931351 RepID=UPI0020416FF6|nr:translocation/assembly module TamB domain-containing protein [Kangiella sp. TOML190]
MSQHKAELKVKASASLKTWLKRSLWTLVSFALICLIVLSIVLHTQFGTRVLIKWLDHSMDSIAIEQISGTLGSKLKLSKLRYSDSNINFQTEKISSHLKSYNLFTLKFEFEHFHLNDTKVRLLEGDKGSEAASSFSGLELPFELTIDDFQLNQLTYLQQSSNIELERIAFDITATGQKIAVNKLQLAAKDYQVTSQLELTLTQELDFKLAPQWRFQQETIEANGHGSIKGNLKTIQLTQALSFAQGEAQNKNLTAKTNVIATIALDNPDIGIESQLEKLEIHYVQAQQRYQLADGNLQLLGTLADYKAIFDAKLIGPLTETAQLKANGQGNLESFELANLSLQSASSSLNSQANLSWKDGLRLAAQGQLKQQNLSQFIPKLAGKIQGSFNLDVTNTNETLDLKITNTQFRGRVNEQDVALDLELSLLDQLMTIEQAKLMLGNNSLTANGKLSQDTLAAELIIKAQQLSLIHPALAGDLNGKLVLSGNIEQPRIVANLTAKQLQAFGNKINNLTAKVNGNPYKKISINSELKGLSAANRLIGDLDFNLDGRLAEHSGNLKLIAQQVTSQLSFNGQFYKDSKSWQGKILQHQLTDKQINSKWNLQQPMSIKVADNISATLSCWLEASSSSKLCFELEDNQNLMLSTHQLDVSLFAPLLPESVQLQGFLNGVFSLESDNSSPIYQSNLELSQGQIKFFDQDTLVYQSAIKLAELTAKNAAKINYLKLQLALEDTSQLALNLAINDGLQLQGQLAAKLHSVDFLSTLTPEIKAVKGASLLNGTIAGNLQSPQLELIFKHAGSIELSRLGRPLSNTQIKINNADLGAYQILLSTNADKSLLESKGVFQLTQEPTASWRYQGTVSADEFELINTKELQLVISPDVTINLTPQQAEVSGDLLIDRGEFVLKEIPKGAVQASDDVVIVDAEPDNKDQFQLLFDINAQIKDSFSLEALGLESKLKGSIKLNNHNERRALMALGRLSLNQGSYSLYGQKLKIDRGVLIFDGPIDNPQIDVVATRLSLDETVTAGVNIGGRPNYLQSSLFSNPSLSELEILSYLISGRGLNDDSNVSSNQMMQTALLFGLKTSSPFFAELQSSLGVDVLTIKEGATSDDSAIEAGKNINDDLYLGYNHGIFNRTGFWLVRYRLTKALKLESTYGENQSVDLIYTIRKP